MTSFIAQLQQAEHPERKNEIFDILGAYEVAVEAEAFKAGFYSAVRLLMGGGQV